jgi:hypothetical protein
MATHINHKKLNIMDATFNELGKFWNAQPFLERLIFLMNKFDFSEDEATSLAKLEFKKFKEEFTLISLNKKIN